jgi:hypothetical protein
LGKNLEKREKEGKEMIGEMSREKNRVLIMLAILMVTAILAAFWAMRGPIGSPPEWQWRERWNLNSEQIKEIRQLIENMREAGASWREIQEAVNSKLSEWKIKPPPCIDIELFYTVKTVVSTINIALAAILLVMHVKIYSETRSEFTVRLIIFSFLLLLYTLTSNPIFQWIFGFRAFGLGPFAMLPDLFTCIALSLLLYLSIK